MATFPPDDWVVAGPAKRVEQNRLIPAMAMRSGRFMVDVLYPFR